MKNWYKFMCTRCFVIYPFDAKRASDVIDPIVQLIVEEMQADGLIE